MTDPTYLPIGRYLGIDGSTARVQVSRTQVREYDPQWAWLLELVSRPLRTDELARHLAGRPGVPALEELVASGLVVAVSGWETDPENLMPLCLVPTVTGSTPSDGPALFMAGVGGEAAVTGLAAMALTSTEDLSFADHLALLLRTRPEVVPADAWGSLAHQLVTIVTLGLGFMGAP